MKFIYPKIITSKKTYFRFIFVIMAAHVIAYLVAGAISYQFITKNIWEGPDPLLSNYLRTPGNEEIWRGAMIWQIPGQILRGLFIALVMLPLCNTLKDWSGSGKFIFLSSLLFVMTHLSAAAPSPANIEGLIYMRPEYIKSGFIIMQPEMILYSVIAGLLFSRFAFKKELTASRATVL